MSSHIEVRSCPSIAADQTRNSSDATAALPAPTPIDDTYLRKKFKKRDRSPNSMLNESPPPAAATDAAPVPQPASSCLTPSTQQQQQKKEKQRPETWNKNEQQIFFNALRQVSSAAND